MKTPWPNYLAYSLGGVLLLTLVSGCQRLCQAPSQEVARSITQSPWRLVRTNNPEFKNNNKYTFIIMEFAQDFSGAVKKVVNNREFENPVSVLKYNLETQSGREGTVRIEYKDAASQEGAASTKPSEVTDYRYRLDRGLSLEEVDSGYSYEFVPYQGIVDPDNSCTF